MSERNLYRKSDGNWAYRPVYKLNWEIISDEYVQESFNKHFAGQEFDAGKAEAAVNLERQKPAINLVETTRTPSTHL